MTIHSVPPQLTVLLSNTDAPGWVLLLAGILFAGAGVATARYLIRKNKK